MTDISSMSNTNLYSRKRYIKLKNQEEYKYYYIALIIVQVLFLYQLPIIKKTLKFLPFKPIFQLNAKLLKIYARLN